MVTLDFDDIRKRNLLLYEFVRGSRCHGIAIEEGPYKSDWDYGGVYMAPAEQLIGLGLDYQDQVSDEKHDTVWHELNKYMNLLLKSNPTVMESLFVDPEFVVYEHPIITEIKKHRDEFVTKACFPSFYGYAQTQIEKARGLNKKIVNPITERKTPLDYCYTYYKQGSSSITEWLAHRNLRQEFCGLVNINHMRDNYSVFYDWGAQMQADCITADDLIEWLDLPHDDPKRRMVDLIISTYRLYEIGGPREESVFNPFEGPIDSTNLSITVMLDQWYKQYCKPIGYRGIQKANGNDVHCSSIAKFEPPICYINYNRDGYSTHCKKYKEYVDWEKKRNAVRYQSNLNKNYDAKNMCECFRLINMGMEIARGEGVKVNRRSIDREFLLDIKAHKFEYDYLIGLVQEKKAEMDAAMAVSTLPDNIDVDKVNDILIGIRREQLGIK